MKRLLILLLTGLFAQFLISCYPEGADNVEDYDVAITNYDKSVDFQNFTTFSMPDTIVYFSDGQPGSIDHQYDQKILETVKQNFVDMGYTSVAAPEGNGDPNGSGIEAPSFIVMVSAFSNVNYSYFVDNWYNNWNWYWNWYWPGMSFNPYYPWYPVSIYSYRTGSVIIEMVDPNVRSDNKINVVWTGIADGLLQGSKESIVNRTTKEINQCFMQSPYLKK